ncbi:hypothetical protein [Enterococcus thailandicus]|uniref:hypothetical protein n=1 Tax=Enterococcus thailandicus TaxID=417368 RepID=UPI0022E04A65|nr:hypothetical protein [Enterococcus thailandicus]MDK4352663.1 hypothetical protein [Enterococcus thailandicus]MDT2734883.1 hypothetical protein [Enterococcus thailandicus]
MNMLDKLNKLKQTLESSPEELKKFMTEYEQFRNKITYDEIKNNDEKIFIAQTSFFYLNDSNMNNESRKNSKYVNKKSEVIKIGFETVKSNLDLTNSFRLAS